MNSTSSVMAKVFGQILFASRWVLGVMYLGLVVAQAIYAYYFIGEVGHLVLAAPKLEEAELLLGVLGLIDIVMVGNLILMVTLGGYNTFVSNLHIEDHPDRPEWLQHINASALKVKLTTALIGVSSIHLLKTFMNAQNISNDVVVRQICIHVAFILASFVLAKIDSHAKVEDISAHS